MDCLTDNNQPDKSQVNVRGSLNLASINTESELDPSILLSEKLADFFSFRLSNLETSYQEKECEILYMMKLIHEINQIANAIRTNLPPYKIVYVSQKLGETIVEDLNSSRLSTMSKRSGSAKRLTSRNFNTLNNKEKYGAFSQKVAINIHDSIMYKKTNNTVKSKINDRSVYKIDLEMKSILSPKQDKKGFLEGQNSTITKKSKWNKTRKINSDELSIKNVDNKSNYICTINKGREKANKILIKKGYNTKLETSPKRIDVNESIVNNSYGSKFNLIINPGSTLQKEIIYSNLKYNPANLRFSSYKLEPKNNKKSTANLISEEISHTKSNINTSIIQLKNDEKYEKGINKLFEREDIFSLLCSFTSKQEHMLISKLSKDSRRAFLQFKINDISREITTKRENSENPLASLSIWFEESEIAKNNIILSNLNEISKATRSFSNLINLLYILIFENVSEEEIDSKIDEINNYIKRKCSETNVLMIMNQLISKLKARKIIYQIINEQYTKDKNFGDYTDLPKELDPLKGVLLSIFKVFKTDDSMELMIEIEILLHKMDKLKKFSEFN
jgi:hypothetical protein